jgi:hypothetical protein
MGDSENRKTISALWLNQVELRTLWFATKPKSFTTLIPKVRYTAGTWNCHQSVGSGLARERNLPQPRFWTVSVGLPPGGWPDRSIQARSVLTRQASQWLWGLPVIRPELGRNRKQFPPSGLARNSFLCPGTQAEAGMAIAISLHRQTQADKANPPAEAG